MEPTQIDGELAVDQEALHRKNDYLVGSGNDTEHERLLEACKTLKKK